MECGGLPPLWGGPELAPCGGVSSAMVFHCAGAVCVKCGCRRGRTGKPGPGESGGKPRALHKKPAKLGSKAGFEVIC